MFVNNHNYLYYMGVCKCLDCLSVINRHVKMEHSRNGQGDLLRLTVVGECHWI